MKKPLSATGSLASLAALGILALAGPASASSHREAPAMALDPAADNTDLWAWVSPGAHDELYVVAAYNPLEEPSGGPNFHRFSDDVLYSIHIARGDQSLDDVVRYDIRFKTSRLARVDVSDPTKPPGGGKEFFSQLSGQTQTYTVTRIEAGAETVVARDVPVAPPNIGPRTNKVAYQIASGVYDDAFAATFIAPTSEQGRAFAGPRDDSFYVDLGGIFDLANLRPAGMAQDGVAGYNCHAIALEIPTRTLTGTGQPPTAGASDAQTLGIWASASRRKVAVHRHDDDDDDLGPWVQVSRLGLPLVNEAVIGLQDKD